MPRAGFASETRVFDPVALVPVYNHPSTIGEVTRRILAHGLPCILVDDESVPRGRLYGRYATHVWVWINTLSLDIRDSMCGFRVYPLASLVELLDDARIGWRMDFDTDVIVRLHWRGVPVVNQPTRVTYPRDGISHFRMGRDNLRISWMHARLFAGMLLRAPMLLWRKVGA